MPSNPTSNVYIVRMDGYGKQKACYMIKVKGCSGREGFERRLRLVSGKDSADIPDMLDRDNAKELRFFMPISEEPDYLPFDFFMGDTANYNALYFRRFQ